MPIVIYVDCCIFLNGHWNCNFAGCLYAECCYDEYRVSMNIRSINIIPSLHENSSSCDCVVDSQTIGKITGKHLNGLMHLYKL